MPTTAVVTVPVYLLNFVLFRKRLGGHMQHRFLSLHLFVVQCQVFASQSL